MAEQKLSFKEFEAKLLDIEKQTVAAMREETMKAKTDRINRLLSNYGEFFNYYLGHYAKKKVIGPDGGVIEEKCKCAWFHIWAAHMLLSYPMLRLLWGLFRGAAKSVHANVGFPLFLKAHKELNFMVLAGQNKDKACILISDIQAEFMANELYKNDFGEQFSHGSWENGDFRTKDGCRFYAMGIGQDPRGLRDGANRPDYGVIDDADSLELSRNPDRVQELTDWVADGFMGCFDGPRQRFIITNNLPFVNQVIKLFYKDKVMGGTKVPIEAIMPEPGPGSLPQAPGAFKYEHKGFWHFLQADAVDAQGNPSWPEKYTAEWWQIVKNDRTYRSWMREYMNTPIVEGKIFKKEWIRWKAILSLEKYDALVCYADPSWKATANSDHKAVVLMGKRGKEIHIIKVLNRITSITTMVKFMYDVYESCDYKRRNAPFNLPLDGPVYVDFYMETNLNQDEHLKDFVAEGELRGYQLAVRGDLRAKGDKGDRIETYSANYERLFVFHNEAEKENPDMMKAIEHKLAYNKDGKTPDDELDAEESGKFFLDRRSASKDFEMRTGERDHSTHGY